MRGAPPLDLARPGPGRWRVHNSPADRVPSHGTEAFASARAIDLTPVDDRGRSARVRPGTLLLPERPDRFAGYGRPILAPIDGVVVRTADDQEDHRAHRGLPSVAYLFTQGRRAAHGWRGVAGNHVVIAVHGGAAFVALCHLREGSVLVSPGQSVLAGQPVAACGNSGKSTEPHVHLQAMTTADPLTAGPVPFTLDGSLPRSGAVIGSG